MTRRQGTRICAGGSKMKRVLSGKRANTRPPRNRSEKGRQGTLAGRRERPRFQQLRESQRRRREDAVEPKCPKTCFSSYRMLQERGNWPSASLPIHQDGRTNGWSDLLKISLQNNKNKQSRTRDSSTQSPVPHLTAQVPASGTRRLQGGPRGPAIAPFRWLAEQEPHFPRQTTALGGNSEMSIDP